MRIYKCACAARTLLWRRPGTTLLFLVSLTAILVSLATAPFPEEVDKPAAAPMGNRLTLIDPGHGGPDPGASSPAGMREKDLVLDIGLSLRDYLEDAGCTVLMTRESDHDLSATPDASLAERKRVDLHRRSEIIEASGADVVISLHANAVPSSRWRGAQVFYRPDRGPENERLARSIQQALVDITGETDRDINITVDQYILAQTELPAVNVEVGFLSNPRDAELLAEKLYRKKVAWAIHIGILRYFARAGDNGTTRRDINAWKIAEPCAPS